MKTHSITLSIDQQMNRIGIRVVEMVRKIPLYSALILGCRNRSIDTRDE